MFNLNDIIKQLEDERNRPKSIPFAFSSWANQMDAIAKSVAENERKKNSFNPMTASWAEQLKYMVEFLEDANDDRDEIYKKLDALVALGNISTDEVDELLDELIIALKKLRIM